MPDVCISRYYIEHMNCITDLNSKISVSVRTHVQYSNTPYQGH